MYEAGVIGGLGLEVRQVRLCTSILLTDTQYLLSM
jgi:hypothetical protein